MVFSSLDLALDYLALNPTRYLFPIKKQAKFPPLIQNNLAMASNDVEQIRAWAAKFPGCNWGCALKKSGVLVVDVDTKPGKVGQATYDGLGLLYEWPATETVTTPSGGFHYYHEGEHVFALGANGFGQDIDSPNYTLIPGCVFADGTSYEAIPSPAAAKTPAWFYEVIKNAKKDKLSGAADVAVDLDKPANIKWCEDYLRNDAEPSIEGNGGEHTLFKVACSLRDNGISESMAVEMINKIYNVPGICEPEWPIEQLTQKVKNAYAYASLAMAGGKTAEADFGDDDAKAAADAITPSNPNATKQRKAKQEKAKKVKQKISERPDGERERVWTVGEVSDAFVYIANIDRFVKVAEPWKMWKKVQFDSFFAYIAARHKMKSGLADFFMSSSNGPFRRFEEMAYLPGQPQFLGNGMTFNSYTPSGVVPIEGDTSWWDAHLEYLFPEKSDRDHVLNWLAWLLQNISLKPKHALLIQGPIQGTGKTFISKMLCELLGDTNVSTVSQSNLQGTFNGWAQRAKLLVIEELRAVDRMEVKSKLHDLVTEERISINIKGLPTYDTDNCFGMIGMTNDDAAISLDDSDRRYLVVRTDAVPRPAAYYHSLYAHQQNAASLSALAHVLMNRDLGAYNGQDRAPDTKAKTAMISAGMTDLEAWVTDNVSNWPLNGRLIQISDVVEVLPKRLERHGRLNAVLCGLLKKHVGAVSVGQQRVGAGKRGVLYAINGCAIANFGEDSVAAIYMADKAKAGAGSDGSAESDFGV